MRGRNQINIANTIGTLQGDQLGGRVRGEVHQTDRQRVVSRDPGRLNLTVLQVTGVDAPTIIRMLIALGSTMFLVSSFAIFFYTIYPTKKTLWTTTAVSFLLGLSCSLIAVIVILVL